MLKAPFIPYSEKLRQATQRRIAANLAAKVNLQIGDRAPDFTLYNTATEEISLTDLLTKSNVVLLFFPLAFTSVCTDELCFVRDNMNHYSQLNAIVVGISIDSMFALKKFQEEQELTFDLLSDFNKDTARKYRVFYEEFPLLNMKGVSKRAAFVINQKGLIQHIDISDDPGKLPNFEKIEEALHRCTEETN